MADMQIVPACKNVEAQYVEMMVPLYSYGCEKKVKKTLSHLKGKFRGLVLHFYLQDNKINYIFSCILFGIIFMCHVNFSFLIRTSYLF